MCNVRFVAAMLLVGVMSAAQVALGATNYYVRNAGNDSSDGKSPATAWKTLANVNTQSFFPGDSILFERGGVWNERLEITTSGISGNPIVYGAYGEGARPVFNGIDEVEGWSTAGNWTNEGNNVWSIATWGTVYGRVWINGVEKERSRYGAEGVGITAEYPWQKINNKLYLYSTGNPATIYTSLKITNQNDFLTETSEKDYITTSHLEIKGWLETGIRGCSHWIIEYCDFTYSFVAITVERNGSTPSVNGIIRHCNFNTKYPFFYVRVNGLDTGNWEYLGSNYGLSMRGGGIADWDIHDNYFKGWGYTAFTWGNHSINGHMTEGIKFYNNYYDGSNLNYGRAFGGHQYLAQTSAYNPIEIFNNYFYSQAVPSQSGTPWIRIYNNIWNIMRGTHYSYADHALSLMNYDGRPSYKNKIYNNIFAYGGWVGMHIGLNGPDRPDLEDLELVNNIFYNNGTDGGWEQFRINDFSTSEALINPRIENNVFWADQATNNIRVLNQTMDVATFNALDGTNHQQLNPQGNIQADPLFVDPANGEFWLQANSPAIGAGLTPISATDAAGNAWNNPPSIGPYEYSSSTRASESILSQSFLAIKLRTTQGAIVIELGQSRTASIKVALYDGRGRRVSLLRGSGGKSLRLETKAFAPGVYTMQILIDGRSYTRRIAVSGRRQLRM